ncbi:MBL fold metallo-hydrolase [Paraglaciecola chathamensis]|uniref:MBL fold metallo-hydrolase n=1 Tax=Paraglaciecola chathamensis TaxID=368405 RepID=A0A8H9IA44_9ALTE|nr:MBL fold metallo-hydrolase [Paraglaciecola oceanifecundans]GGZ65142.1 MBL fold metallo-hydrolase [Paraglaciecola oceanifecundans]
MELTFYGVRGSVPTPGAEYVKYGGNTACVHIELNDGTDIIIDAGTGIRALGQKLVKKDGDIHLLLSHNHWDHIQGFPFFAPIFQPKRNIHITPGQTTLGEHDNILKQMSGSYFPVQFDTLQSSILLDVKAENIQQWHIGKAKITRQKINHPGGGSAYSIIADGKKVVYITDNELYPPYKKSTDFLDWVEFARDADLVVHDAQYMLADMPGKAGWGHSVAEEAVKLTMACRAKRLALYSHDHSRTDDNVAAVEAHCQELVAIAEADLELFAAAEGMCITL